VTKPALGVAVCALLLSASVIAVSTRGLAAESKASSRDRQDVAAARLAKSIVAGRSLRHVVSATRTALARGGIATAVGRRTLRRAARPLAYFTVTPLETLNIALEARSGGHAQTLDELARHMKRLGFPFRSQSAPGRQLTRFLRVWVREARKRPRDARNFAPLFLAEMAKRRSPSIDLARGRYRPEQLRLGLLELTLLHGAFRRPNGVPGRTSAGRHRELVQQATATSLDPCSALKKSLDFPDLPKEVKDLIGRPLTPGDWLRGSAGKAFAMALSDLWGKAGGGKLTDEEVGRALKVMKILAIVQKLAAVYGKVELRVFTQDFDSVHKPLRLANQPSTRPARFGAVAGINEHDWQEYQRELEQMGRYGRPGVRSVRDCFGFLGLPVPTTVEDLARELKNWHVTWKLSANDQDARITDESQFDAGFRRQRLRAIPGNAFEHAAALTIAVQPEELADHRSRRKLDECTDSDPCASATATAHAELRTDKPPNLNTFRRVMEEKLGLGLAESIAELAAGWLQSLMTIDEEADLDITFHTCPTGRGAKAARHGPAQSSQAELVCTEIVGYDVSLNYSQINTQSYECNRTMYDDVGPYDDYRRFSLHEEITATGSSRRPWRPGRHSVRVRGVHSDAWETETVTTDYRRPHDRRVYPDSSSSSEKLAWQIFFTGRGGQIEVQPEGAPAVGRLEIAALRKPFRRTWTVPLSYHHWSPTLPADTDGYQPEQCQDAGREERGQGTVVLTPARGG
jgi:hypothetical protein